jgi:branched-chain amino acid transport system substrate-binding protein
MKQWQEFGMSAGGQRPVAELLFDTDVHGMGLNIAAGLTSVTGWFWELDDASKAFGRHFFERHGAMPTGAQAAVYSGITHYLKAVAAVGTRDTGAVLKQMRATPVDDFFGRGARIREDGKLMHDFYVFEVKKPEESKGPWEYYKLLATVPASEAYPPVSESECPLLKK